MSEGIALAFSGGVDSSIAAIQLARAGYDVHAVYLRMWKWKGENINHAEIEERASEIAKLVKIKFIYIEAGQAMQTIVVEDFRRQLAAGLTPSPCIRCNPMLKFDLLLKYADEHALGMIATGHYARIKKMDEGYYGLFRARDLTKDQSYMLSSLSQAVLSRTIFPLGDTVKKENVKIAGELGLSISDQPESQDLCFLNQHAYEDFLKESSPEILIPGDIVNREGEVLGKHLGLALYTIGQRKGIRIASEEAYYVLKKDVPNNRLVVGYLADLGKDSMQIEHVNWISAIEIENADCDVKIRYRSKLYPCRIRKNKGMPGYIVQFNEKIRDITPGQFAVFYTGDEVLGGGMITKAL
jgi:tRNA-specific 2-thiouridylase